MICRPDLKALMASPPDVTALLADWSRGDRGALGQLVPLVYAELKGIEARQPAKERTGHTLQPTALVHEVYLRLVDQRKTDWQNRAHVFGVAAQISPNGELVAFLSDLEGKFDPWVSQVGTGLFHNVTRGFPALAPSGVINFLTPLDPQRGQAVSFGDVAGRETDRHGRPRRQRVGGSGQDLRHHARRKVPRLRSPSSEFEHRPDRAAEGALTRS